MGTTNSETAAGRQLPRIVEIEDLKVGVIAGKTATILGLNTIHKYMGQSITSLNSPFYHNHPLLCISGPRHQELTERSKECYCEIVGIDKKTNIGRNPTRRDTLNSTEICCEKIDSTYNFCFSDQNLRSRSPGKC